MRPYSPLVFIALVFSVVALAQPPRPWWENPVGNGLNLSDTQRDKINSIVSEYRDRLTLERQEADRAEQDFENVVNADTVERRRGWTAVEQLVKARGVFTKDMAEFTLRLRAVLTADQWRILREREGERRFNDGKGPRPDGGRGRRGGPPPAVPSSTSPAH